ncbi:MAG: dTDP-4-dehydrorhamnose reductase [Pseudomonadota bacterium]
MRILLTGKNGQVGWELQRTLAILGDVIALDRNGMDLSNADSIRQAIRQIKPNLIVNAAAYTAVDKAESEPGIAMAINGVAPGIMAEEAKRLNAAIIHYSTDYIFDGMKTSPYIETDIPNPVSVYGRTKLAGEQAIAAVDVAHMIFRTSWVYGLRGKNFLLTMQRLAKERNELRIVNDQFGAPTWCRTIAEATALAIARLPAPFSEMPKEIYHLTAIGKASWFEFAVAIMRHSEKSSISSLPTIVPITTHEYPLPAKRPVNSRLSVEKFTSAFGFQLPPWAHGLALCMDY